MHNPGFLENYQEELTLIHKLMGEFAKQHPKVAARLRLNKSGVSDDDHVGRLLEASALSAAKARFHLEDEFSEISDYFLEHLHPHAAAPIPSMSLVQFTFDRKKLTGSQFIPAQSTLLTDPIQEQRCIFNTCYPVNLLPLECTEAKLMEKPLQAPVTSALSQSASVLRLRLNSADPAMILADLQIPSLRFFIRAEAKLAYALYELLFNQTLEVALAKSPHDPDPILLGKECLKPVGFEINDALLPYGKHTPIGYRLLTEFFTFPEKFLFFDIGDLKKAIQKKFSQRGDGLEFYFYFKQGNTELLKKMNADFFALHCTPAVNLFENTCDPLILNEIERSYPLSPIKRKSVEKIEIYRLEHVMAVLDQKDSVEILPFHGLTHHQNAYYYHIDRKPAWYFGHYPTPGAEIQLRFTDLQNKPLQSNKWKIFVKTLCTHRDLPAQLALKNGSQSLTLERKIEAINEVQCIVPFTRTYHPFLKQKYKWRYISHISLDFLWGITLDNAALFFCSLLDLYAFDAEKHKLMLGGILDIHCQNTHAIRQSKSGISPIWHGTEVTLMVDENKFEKTGLYLFACVLDRFLPIFATTNLYTQLVVANRKKVLFEFAPRRGEKAAI